MQRHVATAIRLKAYRSAHAAASKSAAATAVVVIAEYQNLPDDVRYEIYNAAFRSAYRSAFRTASWDVMSKLRGQIYDLRPEAVAAAHQAAAATAAVKTVGPAQLRYWTARSGGKPSERRALEMAAMVLPADMRARYALEWCSDLARLPPGSRRSRYLLEIFFCAAPRMAFAVRRRSR